MYRFGHLLHIDGYRSHGNTSILHRHSFRWRHKVVSFSAKTTQDSSARYPSVCDSLRTGVCLFVLFYLCRVLVVACGLLSCGMHAGSSSPTRDRTWAPCIGSVESYPLGHQGSPRGVFCLFVFYLCSWLCWVLVAACGISFVAACGLLSSCGAGVSL